MPYRHPGVLFRESARVSRIPVLYTIVVQEQCVPTCVKRWSEMKQHPSPRMDIFVQIYRYHPPDHVGVRRKQPETISRLRRRK